MVPPELRNPEIKISNFPPKYASDEKIGFNKKDVFRHALARDDHIYTEIPQLNALFTKIQKKIQFF